MRKGSLTNLTNFIHVLMIKNHSMYAMNDTRIEELIRGEDGLRQSIQPIKSELRTEDFHDWRLVSVEGTLFRWASRSIGK